VKSLHCVSGLERLLNLETGLRIYMKGRIYWIRNIKETLHVKDTVVDSTTTATTTTITTLFFLFNRPVFPADKSRPGFQLSIGLPQKRNLRIAVVRCLQVGCPSYHLCQRTERNGS